jgi:rSAM/selenodomain-associated transferase 2
LSIIIPTRNEAATLPLLLTDLAAQADVDLEVLISDGGSTDGTAALARAELARLGMRGAVLEGSSGRGRQLNRGALQAKGEWLLFLHADSRLPDPAALAKALADLRSVADPRVAGHFRLRFELPATARAFGYHLCELKARLGLPGTIHGDQGFLLSAGVFRELGGFREDLPVLEDTLLAERIRKAGGWRLLPAELVTSPRRFQTEGFRQRQTVNALLMNFAAIGWEEPLRRAPDVYRDQERTGPLQPARFYPLVDALLRGLPRATRLRLWYQTGGYVRGNAWQLALWRTARRSWRQGRLEETETAHAIEKFQSWFEPLTDHPPGRALAGFLTWLWFRTRRRDVV